MKKFIIINNKKINKSDLKHFTEADLHQFEIDNVKGAKRIYVLQQELVENPLWFHKQNLMQTATGYGSKLVSEKMIYFENKLRRIYVTIYSNSGTSWFNYKGEKIVVD